MSSQASRSCQLAGQSSGLRDYSYIRLFWRRGNWISPFRPFKTYNNFIPGIVLSTQPYKIEVFLKNNQFITIYKKNLGLLKKDLAKENPAEKLIKPGSVMRFFKKKRDWVVTQLPEVESALISMDPNTGAIVALVGGFSFKKNKYKNKN